MQIKAPNKSYTGESFGIMFQHGIGKTDDQWLISRFKEKGFIVEKEPEEVNVPDLKKQIAGLEAENKALKKKIDESKKEASRVNKEDSK
ncbi:MAG: hypothetical protein ACLUQ0_05405 [Enterococcus italicus]|uniref:hypothetical protein n=1 Tax=Enterococcus italicus TaxID=246144 RepID=UPI0039919A80